MNAFICSGVSKECLNPYDSYGEICVHCNACGRDDVATMYDCQIKLYTDKLEEEKTQLNDSSWDKFQRKNIESNIEYFVRMLSNVVKNKRRTQNDLYKWSDQRNQ